MKRSTDGSLKFEEIEGTFTQKETLTFTPGNGSRYSAGNLVFKTQFDLGFLKTNGGNLVKAMRSRQETLQLSLKDSSGRLQAQFKDLKDAEASLNFRPGTIVPGYNCHGFTFADGQFWIDNSNADRILDTDGYETTTADKADIAVFLLHSEIVHSTKFDPQSMQFDGKSGVREHVRTRDELEATEGIKFDEITYYRSI